MGKFTLSDREKRAFEWRTSRGLNAINQMEELYIYKPWGRIFYTLGVQIARFAVLTLISFDMLVWFAVPAWAMILYEFYLALKWLEKFDISMLKILAWAALAEACLIFLSPFVRKFIWYLISGIWL